MKGITVLFIFFSMILPGFTQSSGNGLSSSLEFSTNPSEYMIGFTTSIDMQCSFIRGRNSSSSVSVKSMTISFSDTANLSVSKYIASINENSGKAINFSNDVTAIFGAIDSSGLSFIKVGFKYPKIKINGVYKCELNGSDDIGVPLTLSNTTRILEVTPDINALVSDLGIMRQHLESLREIVADLQIRLNLIRESLFFSLPIYNGHRYYMAIDMDHFIYSEAQAVCELHGGYLVEIDTHEEFVFLRDFIQKNNIDKNYKLVMTGATDIDQEGVWINQHNISSSPLFDWYPGKPNTNKDNNCQSFGIFNSIWYLVDSSCDFLSVMKENSFICEIPEDEEINFV